MKFKKYKSKINDNLIIQLPEGIKPSKLFTEIGEVVEVEDGKRIPTICEDGSCDLTEEVKETKKTKTAKKTKSTKSTKSTKKEK